jgi:hypothetical protein
MPNHLIKEFPGVLLIVDSRNGRVKYFQRSRKEIRVYDSGSSRSHHKSALTAIFLSFFEESITFDTCREEDTALSAYPRRPSASAATSRAGLL